MTEQTPATTSIPQAPLTEKQRQAIARMELPDPVMVQVLSDKTYAERLAIANGMWRSARDTIRNLLRAEHPDWTEEEVHREAARRLLNASTLIE